MAHALVKNASKGGPIGGVTTATSSESAVSAAFNTAVPVQLYKGAPAWPASSPEPRLKPWSVWRWSSAQALATGRLCAGPIVPPCSTALACAASDCSIRRMSDCQRTDGSGAFSPCLCSESPSSSSGSLQPCGSRCRRSSASVNMGCPGLPFPLSPVRTACQHGITSFSHQVDHAGTQLGHTDDSSIDTRFELASLATLKRKGGIEAESPPNKLFVAGVSEHTSLDSPSVSSSEMCTDSGQVLVGSNISAEFSPSPRSPDTATVILSASPPKRFNLPSANFSGL